MVEAIQISHQSEFWDIAWNLEQNRKNKVKPNPTVYKQNGHHFIPAIRKPDRHLNGTTIHYLNQLKLRFPTSLDFQQVSVLPQFIDVTDGSVS